MRWSKNLSLGLVLISLVGSCLKEPVYSIIPYIQLKSFTFKKGPANCDLSSDSLIFVLKFTDGDGDLGINGDETAIYTSPSDSTVIRPFLYFAYDTTTNHLFGATYFDDLILSQFGNNLSYVDYQAYIKIPNHTIDSLVLPTLSCKNWQNGSDTLYFQSNEKTDNFFLEYFIKNSSGGYDRFDFSSIFAFPNCPKDQDRFSVLSSDLGRKAPLDGTLTYRYPSCGIYSTFHGKTVKFRIHITDRAFHSSNMVEVEHTF